MEHKELTKIIEHLTADELTAVLNHFGGELKVHQQPLGNGCSTGQTWSVALGKCVDDIG